LRHCFPTALSDVQPMDSASSAAGDVWGLDADKSAPAPASQG
jgi:hypothetical protein